MIFPLIPKSYAQSLPVMGHPLYRDMPIIPLIACNAGIEQTGRAFVDSMADFILLPDDVAQRLQIDLSNAPARTITVGGGQVTVRFADVELELRHPHGNVKWRSTVAFGPTQRWLFGHFGGLEFFHFTLDAANEEMILVPRENLPPIS